MYIAKGELAYIKSEEIYLVRNLFKSYECNRISRSDRLLIGTLFLNYINTTDSEVTVIEKTFSG